MPRPVPVGFEDMIASEPTHDPSAAEAVLHAEATESKLASIHRREWSLWSTSLTIILLLTAGLIVLSFPAAMHDKSVLESVAGLAILVVLFGGYSTYEKFLINRLRLELAQNHVSSKMWREVALVDPLTKLCNRRYAERRLKEEILRSERKGYPLTLVAFDLNNFKRINDDLGHEAGDAALRSFAECLQKLARESDVVARFGGDEFLLLLTECDSIQAEVILKRFERENPTFDHHAARFPIGFAVGWTQYRLGDQPYDMMKRADELLYQDKYRRKGTISSTIKSPENSDG